MTLEAAYLVAKQELVTEAYIPICDPLEHVRVRHEQGLRPGGFGLAMTRALVDELIFNEKRNEVVLVK